MQLDKNHPLAHPRTMNATALVPMSVLDDDAWDDLLSYIEERRVIPIIGAELLPISTDKGPWLLYDWLADKLAGRLNVNVNLLPQPYTHSVRLWRERVGATQRGAG